MSGSILVVDDKKDMLSLLEIIISEKTDHRVVTESNPLAAVERFREEPFDLVITDLKMPKLDGIKLLTEVKKIDPAASVVVMTAYATIETAVEAIQGGAYDYITKPFKKERILLTIDKVMKWRRMLRENLALRQALLESEHIPSLIGRSPAMNRVHSFIKQVAPASATVLITGASGTGKELVARAVHQHSLRSAKPMITVNCTAIPEQVIESELFGHVKGAFTGAWQNKKGLVESAHEGTLFLDEIGDISPSMQTKLLRLLEQGEYKPVGSVETIKADIRFIAATNHDLNQAMLEKSFREDLYFRLNVVHIHLPSLSERLEDIPLLSHYFLRKYTLTYQKEIRDISPRALKTLLSRQWLGNVRELENIIERAVIFCSTDTLEVQDLLLESEPETACPEVDEEIYRLPFKEAKDHVLRRFHRHYVQYVLRESEGNISRAAERAGMQRQYLHQLIKEAGITTGEFKTLSE